MIINNQSCQLNFLNYLVQPIIQIQDPIKYHNEHPPICINYGCNSKCTYGDKDETGKKRYRIHCGNCQKASYGAKDRNGKIITLKEGVTAYKTGKCCNHDSHLGFECPVNFDKMPSWGKGLTEVDHINGNCNDNDLKNLQELCKYCHDFKGQLNGDYDNTKNRKQ